MPPDQTPPPITPTPEASSGSTETTELQATTTTEAPKAQSSLQNITKKSRNYGRVVALLSIILVLGAVGGYFISIGTHPTTTPNGNTVKVQSLSPADIAKLSQVGNQLGTSNQVLTIGANTVFSSKVNVGSNLTIAGPLNANGPTSLSTINVSGQSNLTNLAISQALQVKGLTNAQAGLSVVGLSSLSGDLTVSGAVSVGALSATTISAKAIQLNGPFTVGHLVSSGANLSSSSGASIGSGGTTNISGNDTAGTVNINIGTGASAGTLVSVAFKSAFGGVVHVMLTPRSAAAASASYYTTPSASGFTINTASAPGTGTLSFDYFVIQ